MENQYPPQILKIQQEKKLIQAIYGEFYQKLIFLDLSIDEEVNVSWILDNLSFDIDLPVLTEEQKKVVLSFRDIYIGVYWSAGIWEAHDFAMSILRA